MSSSPRSRRRASAPTHQSWLRARRPCRSRSLACVSPLAPPHQSCTESDRGPCGERENRGGGEVSEHSAPDAPSRNSLGRTLHAQWPTSCRPHTPVSRRHLRKETKEREIGQDRVSRDAFVDRSSTSVESSHLTCAPQHSVSRESSTSERRGPLTFLLRQTRQLRFGKKTHKRGREPRRKRTGEASERTLCHARGWEGAGDHGTKGEGSSRPQPRTSASSSQAAFRDTSVEAGGERGGVGFDRAGKRDYRGSRVVGNAAVDVC